MASRSGGPAPWLCVCRHRVRGIGTPFVLILQHGIITSPTRIVAPVVPAGAKLRSVLEPPVRIDGAAYVAFLLGMSAVSASLIGSIADAVEIDADDIMAGLDAIFRGYPVALPPL